MREVKRRTVQAGLVHLYGAREIEGVPTAIADPTVEWSKAERNLTAAFGHLHGLAPFWWRTVRRYVRHIVIWPGDYTAFDRLGGVHLASSHVVEWSSEHLAAAIVHEATHLRVRSRGIGYDPHMRDRIETLCVREQAAVLGQLPAVPQAEVIAVLQGINEPWWTSQDREARIERNLADAGISKWIRRLVSRISN